VTTSSALDKPGEIWPILDGYEGCGPDDPLPHAFQRESVSVRMDDRQLIRATAYIYRGDVSASTRIEAGDLLAENRRETT
jgi:hypothetical protein